MSSPLTKKIKQYYLLFAINLILYIFPLTAILESGWYITKAVLNTFWSHTKAQWFWQKRCYNRVFETRSALVKEMWPGLYKEKDGGNVH